MACYLVTGGCGFIGSHLVDALIAAGHRVRVLDDLSTGKQNHIPPSAELMVSSVTDANAVARAMADIDGCFHLAAIASVDRSREDWLGTHAVNLTGTIRLLEAARARKTPFVYASSAAVYGSNQQLPLNETQRPTPLTAYGADKLGCELHACAAWEVHGVPSTGLRFFNVYGPRQDPASPYSGVISIFMGRIQQGLPITIHGDGEQSRDFIYIGDVVAMLTAAMENLIEGSTVLNTCTGIQTSVRTLSETLLRLSGACIPLLSGPARTGDVRHSQGNPEAAAHLLGVRAHTTLEEGLHHTWHFFQKNAGA
jgi:UDP-glucose 4-epimerase